MGVRRRLGLTLVELLISSVLSLTVLILIVLLVSTTGQLWYRVSAEISATEALSRVVSQISPTLRSAIRVNTTQSDSSKVTVVLPKVDTTTGDYLVPLTDGDTVAFYLSDTTGALGTQGTFLWRSVNGVPDTGWSLRGAKGRIDLGIQSLAFTYTPTTDPKSVQFTVGTSQSSGNRSVAQQLSTEVELRNHP